MALTPNYWRDLRILIKQRVEAERAEQANATARWAGVRGSAFEGHEQKAREAANAARLALDQQIRLMESIGLKEHP